MKIHAFCSDNAIPSDYAKLYVYIYVKSVESPDGTDYFNQKCEEEIIAIKSLLSNDCTDAMTYEEPLTPEDLQEIYKTFVNKSLHKLERDIQMEYGLENVFRTELMNRLRLHTDPSFRAKHIGIFNTTIFPGISDYSERKINISNINHQIKLAKEEKEFDVLFDL